MGGSSKACYWHAITKGNLKNNPKRNKGRQILPDLTFMWNLKKSPTHSNRVEWWLPEAEGMEERGDELLIKEHKLSVIR